MLKEILTKRQLLTVHALSPENLSKSYKEGVTSYVPKDEIANIATFLNDILVVKEIGKSFWWRWADRSESYFDRRSGFDWQDEDKDILGKLKYVDL